MQDKGITCGARGLCNDGVLGSGLCICTRSLTRGMWAGSACEDCLTGYYGPSCLQLCPTNAAHEVCSAHGLCSDGVAGDGTCTCESYYAGRVCATACPVANGAVCNGIGTCNDGSAGDGTCDCRGAAVGSWAGVACTECAAGWVGRDCDLRCPTGPGDASCAGHGSCYARAKAAHCDCFAGFAGAACARECPGGALNPCSGHGQCDSTTALCACDRSPATGYWGAATCDACAAGWSGESCDVPCPVGIGGAACSGARCWNGLCLCEAGTCGRVCNLTGDACRALTCPPGLWGVGCAGVCPGGLGNVCNGHGNCHGNGACECAAAWAGAACGLLCPGGVGGPCSGHGACLQTTGQCKCRATYATADCAVQCPVRHGRVCAGHGVCRDGAARDGACVCDPGFATASCGVRCPGTSFRGNATETCSGHGACDGATATCACDATPGVWAGPDCSACAPGYSGADCTDVCMHGRTVGRACVCDPGYGLPNCTAACPGVDRNCSGHGACLDGSTRDATCACDADYYTANCSVQCVAEDCFPASVYPTPHAQCNAQTGACECQDNDGGHWGGPHCNRCRLGFWGQQCDLVCMCSGHGACGWLDGVCECFFDATLGHWAGDHCEGCAEGYLSPLCIEQNVRISRAGDLTAVSTGRRYDGTSSAVVDEAHELVYTGGQPLLVFHTEDGSPAAQLDLGGIVRGGFVATTTVALLVEYPGTQERHVVHVTRGMRPVVYRTSADAEQRRRLAPQAVEVAGVVRFSELFGHNGRSYSVVLTDQAFGIRVQGPDRAVLWDTVVPAASVALDKVRAGKMWDHPTLGLLLVLVGTWRSSWQVCGARRCAGVVCFAEGMHEVAPPSRPLAPHLSSPKNHPPVVRPRITSRRLTYITLLRALPLEKKLPSTTCRRDLQVADCVYLWQTVSTNHNSPTTTTAVPSMRGRGADGLFAQQEREPIRGRPAVRGKGTCGGRSGQRVEEQGTWASRTRKHSEAGCGRRPEDRGAWTAKTVKRPRQQPAQPQYANYRAPLTRNGTSCHIQHSPGLREISPSRNYPRRHFPPANLSPPPRVPIFLHMPLPQITALTVLGHWSACFFYFLSGPEFRTAYEAEQVASRKLVPWIDKLFGPNPEDFSVGQRYLTALYWSFTTLTSVGYGDILASTLAERICALVEMVSGTIVFSFVVASCGDLMNAFDRKSRSQKIHFMEVWGASSCARPGRRSLVVPGEGCECGYRCCSGRGDGCVMVVATAMAGTLAADVSMAVTWLCL